MKLKLSLFILIGTIIIFATSCKKENSGPPINDSNTPTAYDSYMPLKVGNSWIYKEYSMSVSGTETDLNITDSSYIEKDTVVNGFTFYKVYTPNHYEPTKYVLLRDSLHYIINESGTIQFSSQDFSHTLYSIVSLSTAGDTIYSMNRKMQVTPVQILISGIRYITYNAQDLYRIYPGFTTGNDTQMVDIFYCKNIGIIKERLPFNTSTPLNEYKKLIRYHVE